MAKIAVIVNAPEKGKAPVLSLLHRLTGNSIGALRHAIESSEPLLEKPLWRNDHKEVAGLLRELLDKVPALGAELKLFELPDDLSYTKPVVPPVREITHEYLRNILARADTELERQKLLMDQELQDEG